MQLSYLISVSAAFFGLAAAGFGQQWELGGAAGFAWGPSRTISNSGGSASAGFGSGFVASAAAGMHPRKHLGGEIRYLYRSSNLKLNGSGGTATMNGATHVIHYDLLLSPAPREAKMRPYVAVGGGAKVFQGSGPQTATQPLRNLALLTKTRQVEPVFSIGGGLAFYLSEYMLFRVDVRDYLSPFPGKVIAPAPGSQIKGVLHDIVPMAGISFVF